MYKINDQVIQLDVPFTVGEGDEAIQYPANWIRQATEEDKESIGLVEVVPEVRPDDRFYFVSDNGDGTFSSVPRNLEELKASYISKLKTTARSDLRLTDWYITRFLDPSDGSEIPQEILDSRKAVKDTVAVKELKIKQAETMEKFIEVTGA